MFRRFGMRTARRSFLMVFWMTVCVLQGSNGRSIRAEVFFNLTFEDVAHSTGLGFDDPTEGAKRREALLDVANNVIGNQLNHSATIDVTVRESRDLAASTLAQAGQTYFVTQGTFQDGFVSSHIQTGVDPSNQDDGSITWDFEVDWYFDKDEIPKGFNDFRSVALHELTHLLGFAGLIKSTGRGLKDTVPDTYSRYDSFIENDAGIRFIRAGSFNFIQASRSDLTTAAFFNGPNANAANNGQRVPLYTPEVFEDGSLGHLADSEDPIAANIVIGTSRRRWSLVDRGILIDLGYQIPDAVISDREEQLADTSLSVTGNLFIGGDQQAEELPGSLTIEETATVAIRKSLKIWSEGTLNVVGDVSIGGMFVNDGRLEGVGHVAGDVFNVAGIVAPGEGTGTLSFANHFSQSGEGTLELELGETATGPQNDVLSIGGIATLGGKLSLLPFGSYTDPTTRGVVDTFQLITSNGRYGVFDVIEYDGESLVATKTVDNVGSFSTEISSGQFRTLIYSDDGIEFKNVSALPGDVDGDGDIDIEDFNVLAVSYDPSGESGPYGWTLANFDDDGDVDIVDYNFLAVNFSPGGYGSTSFRLQNVPEPTTVSIILFGLVMLCILGRTGLK